MPGKKLEDHQLEDAVRVIALILKDFAVNIRSIRDDVKELTWAERKKTARNRALSKGWEKVNTYES